VRRVAWPRSQREKVSSTTGWRSLYTALIGLALTGAADLPQVVVGFGREVVGGVLIGATLGFLFSRLTGAIDDHLIEMTLSTALAYGSYVGAQSVHGSGPLACVAAGIIHGSYGRRVGMSENTRRLLDDLWEYLGFVANAFVFLLVGFSTNVGSLLANAWPVGVAVAAVLLARALLLASPRLLVSEHRFITSPAERVVLAWSGLRGALTIALALSSETRGVLVGTVEASWPGGSPCRVGKGVQGCRRRPCPRVWISATTSRTRT